MKRFDVDNLFLRLYQAYSKCDAVLRSCNTREQLQRTGDWIIDVISVFEDEFELYTLHLNKRKRKLVMDRFVSICDAMTSKWKEYITTHPLMQESEPVEQYKETVVVKGFEDMYEESSED